MPSIFSDQLESRRFSKPKISVEAPEMDTVAAKTKGYSGPVGDIHRHYLEEGSDVNQWTSRPYLNSI